MSDFLNTTPVHNFPQKFPNDTPLIEQAIAEYMLRENLSRVLFYELPTREQIKILSRAQELKDGRRA
jgi:hypothetical protein